MAQRETTVDIVGKGFKYEERVEVDLLIEKIQGTISGFAGVANWGPIGEPVKVIKDFKKYFGTEINRDANTKDFSGMAAIKTLESSQICLFTRISDGTDQKASKLMMKLAKAASIVGNEIVAGRQFKVTEANNTYKTKINDGSDLEVALTLTPGASAIISSVLPTSLTDPAAANYAIGDYFEFYVDGILFQYIITNANDLLCKLVGTGRYDDSYYGGKTGSFVINYVDRLLYALKVQVIGGGDPSRILRKIDTNKISVNSQERGASSVIKINSFPIVFSNASASSPLISSSSNTSAEDIIEEINTVIASVGQAFINSNKKFETRTLIDGVASSILIYPFSSINLDVDFTNNLLTGAGVFDSDPSAEWDALTNGLKANIDYLIGGTITFSNASGVAATSGYQEFGMSGVVGGDNTSLADGDYKFQIAVDGGAASEKTITVSGGPITYTALLALINAQISGATASIESGDIRITSSTSGASSSIALTAGTSTDLFTALSTTLDTAIAGAAATSGYGTITFPASINENDKCDIPAGVYVINLTVDGGAATNHNITVIGNETWGQFASLFDSISGVSGSIISGTLRVISDTTGTSSTVVIAEGTGVATAITLSYDAVDDNIDISSGAGTTFGHSLKQIFTVPSSQANKRMEVYFKPSGSGYTSGIITFSILKGSEVLFTKILTAADITNGVVRSYFYAKEAGSYQVAFKVATISTATSITLDNLYVGPERVQKNNGLLDFLGIKDSEGAYDLTYDVIDRPENKIYGTDANMDMGTFTAYYTGSDGNLISIVKEEVSGIEAISIFMGSSLLAKFVNFSYTVADGNFFGNLINNDTRTNKYISYSLPATPPTVIDSIPNGTYSLSGGTSGVDGVNDAQYSTAIEKYKNMDIYDVDIINVCGNSTKVVVDKIQEVCEYRRDCFGVFDPPEVVAGKPGGIATGGADSMIYWHNGQMPALLNKKLDSKYVVTYFPWVLVKTESLVNSDQWMPPSIVALKTIAGVDASAANTFSSPAGKKAETKDVIDIAYYLTDEEKGRIYDDNIGNNINPIVYTSRNGFFIDGQKTTQRERNAYNRINTMRTSLFIKRKLMEIVPDYYYLPINENTRKEFIAAIEKNITGPLVSASAIKDNYEIICDSNINTAEIEADHGMVAMIIWSPVKSLEKLKVISLMKDQQVVVQF